MCISEQDSVVGVEHAETAVVNLLDGLARCHRTAVADNFFTSISRAKRLLAHDTYLVGTLRCNCNSHSKKIFLSKS